MVKPLLQVCFNIFNRRFLKQQMQDFYSDLFSPDHIPHTEMSTFLYICSTWTTPIQNRLDTSEPEMFYFVSSWGKVVSESYRAWKAPFECLETDFRGFHKYVLGIF